MKKRVLSFWVTGLVIASLAGCGTKADATDQEVPESSAVESEADDSVTDESAGSVEADGEKESSSGFAGAEDENIVLYAEIAEYGEYCSQEDQTFESESSAFESDDIDSKITEKDDSELDLKDYYYSMEDRTVCNNDENIFGSVTQTSHIIFSYAP